MQAIHQETLVTWRGQISNNARSNNCSAIPSKIEGDYSAMTWTHLGFVFSTHTNVFKLKLYSKKLLSWFISANFWRIAIQVLLQISVKISILVSWIPASKSENIFRWKSLAWAVTFAHPIWRGIIHMEFCSCLFGQIANMYLSIRQKNFHETPSSSPATFSNNNRAL